MRKLNNMEAFRRELIYQTQVQDDESILLIGTLKDTYHDIRVEIVVDIETLTISNSCCVVKAAPSPYCDAIQELITGMEGVVIGKGLSRRLNEILGGQGGCGNLRTILIGLLPLVLNVKASLGLTDDEEILETIHTRLQGSCVGYPVRDA